MDYANYQAIPQKIRTNMNFTGSLTGKDGLDVVIRFDCEDYTIDGNTIRLKEAILRMALVVTWPDAVEQHISRVTYHPEFVTVRYHCTVRPLVAGSEEETQKRQIAAEIAEPRSQD